MYRHDVRVIEQCHRFCFVLKPAELIVGGEHIRLEHFERDGPIQADLAGSVDNSHSPLAELSEQLIVAEEANEWQAIGRAVRLAVRVVSRRNARNGLIVRCRGTLIMGKRLRPRARSFDAGFTRARVSTAFVIHHSFGLIIFRDNKL